MSIVPADNHVFLYYGKITFLILLLMVSLCIPVTALMNASADSMKVVHAIMNATGYENQGKALMAERNWSGVISVTNEGLVLYPYDPGLLCLQGYAMRKTGHYQKAVDLVSLALPNDTRPVRYANRGYGFLAMGKYNDAINDADSALAMDPSYATAYALKAYAVRNNGNLTAAEELINKALSIEPGNAHYLHLKGGILADLGNCIGAIDAYRHSIGVNPDYDLPWPGLSNATADLEKTETRCAAPGIRTPPTRAAFPVGMVFCAGIIAVFIMARRTG